MKNKFSALISRKQKNKPVPTDWLKQLNLISAAVYVIIAVAIVALMEQAHFKPVTTSFLSLNENTKNFDLALRMLGDVNIAWVVTAFLLVSAIVHILLATRLRNKYENGLKTGVNKYRWIDSALSGSLVLVAVAMLAGVSELSGFFMIVALMVIISLTGYMLEKQAKLFAKRPNWQAFVIGCVAGFALWKYIASYVAGSLLYGDGTLPWYVLTAAVVTLLAMLGMAIILHKLLKQSGRWANYAYGEQTYLILGAVTKITVALSIFFGLLY